MSSKKIIALNPGTGETIATIDVTPIPALDSILSNARKAHIQWKQIDVKSRGNMLTRLRKIIAENGEELANLIAEETGKTYWDAFIEVFTTVEHLRRSVKIGPKTLKPQRRSTGLTLHKKGWIQYQPHGVVGIISPWNYPLILTMTPIVEALLAGNSVVIKPSELTSKTGQKIRELISESPLPENLVQMIYGYGNLGAALVNSPGTDMICFTGSVEIGKKIATQCGTLLKPVLLELGGKDPMIVLDDADLERAASCAVWGSLTNCGQTCISIERVYVMDSVAEKFIELLKKGRDSIRFGLDKHKNDMGGLINNSQKTKYMKQLDEAQKAGARITSGSEKHKTSKGIFLPPAIVEVSSHDLEIMETETFGPALAVMRVKTEEEAILLANSTGYGLSASVFTKNKSRGRQIASQLKAGSVCINDALVNYLCADLPFGGMGLSGIGRVHGGEGLRGFSQVQTICEDRIGLKKEPWWFPVHPWTSKLFHLLVRYFYS